MLFVLYIAYLVVYIYLIGSYESINLYIKYKFLLSYSLVCTSVSRLFLYFWFIK